MRVPQLVSDFVEWRWAPSVGLTAGSLAFVAFALLLIPTRFGAEPGLGASSFDSPQPQRALYGSSLARSLAEPVEQPPEVARVARAVPQSAAQSNEPRRAPQRGFSPILDRPEPVPTAVIEPPPAPTAVAAPAAPAPAPTTVIIQPVPGGESREVTTQ